MKNWSLVIGYFGTPEIVERHETKRDAVWSAQCWQDGNGCKSTKGGDGVYHVGRYSVVRNDILEGRLTSN